MRSRGAGFTLIEVVIAVAILGFALGTIVHGMGRYADNALAMREKTVALVVAHNRLTEIDLEPTWPALGKSDGDVEMAGASWRWFVAVTESPDPNVRRIDITVRIKGQEHDVAALSSFIAKAGRT